MFYLPFLGGVNFVGESSPDEEIIDFFSKEELPTNESKSSSEVAVKKKKKINV